MTPPTARVRDHRLRWAALAQAGALLWKEAPALWQRYQREARRPVLPAPATPEPHRWSDRGLHAAWLGHSTVLLKIDGLTVLTDPVFSLRAGIHLGLTTLGVQRIVEPAMDLLHLPKIDLVLLSHAHMDHFDLRSLRALESRRTTVVTASRTSDLLRVRRWGAVHELRWGQEVHVGSLHIRATEVDHWGARVRTDTWRGYNGYVLTGGNTRLLFAGDTADTRAFRRVAGSNDVDLAIMPIGAYNPWIRFHCTPEQAWRMATEAHADRVLPVHHSTFLLGREPVAEPLQRLIDAAGARASSIVCHRIGDEFSAV
jgi:L-ascorbate metabolism protein UlaG (beta-lactamase superfamily)